MTINSPLSVPKFWGGLEMEDCYRDVEGNPLEPESAFDWGVEAIGEEEAFRRLLDEFGLSPTKVLLIIQERVRLSPSERELVEKAVGWKVAI